MIRINIVMLLVLGIAGCSGVKPMKVPNHREEGPQGGLFSGPEGAWSISTGGKQTPPQHDSENQK